MRLISFIVCLVIVLLPPACAGQLFDDYLNYVRPGSSTGPGSVSISATSSQPAGESFSVPANTSEIYRIGIRPVYDTWNTGEQVTLVLYDSPQKDHKLASYSVDQATSRVQPVADTQDRVLYFQLRAPVGGRSQFYFEISVSGGDGSVSFQAFDKDAYSGGECYPSIGVIKDVAFECHIKPTADREANLKRFFTERLDLNRPDLGAVKAAVEANDWEKAIAETVSHFSNRMDLWDDWKDVMEVKLDPKYDLILADLVMKNSLRHKESQKPVPWRMESYWAPEYAADRAIPSHAAEPETYSWHLARFLTAAYTATGKPEYAQKAVEILMQFVLDNPSPKTSGLPHYFEVWNDRTAGARAPGHGTLVYSRLYNYPGWNNDQKLILLSFFEDNAHWDLNADSGANWGAEAARACLDFGLSFPEWKMSREYVRWGAGRLGDIVQETARGDGVSTESSVKYHAMVARRLKGVMEYAKAGCIDFDAITMQNLMSKLDGMYGFMAYTLQPDSNVVMCGDSWYENFTGELADAAKMIDRPDFLWIASQGKQGTLPKEVSKVFPESGYFIMRSDFGGKGLDYKDARQLYIHNGGWFGSHGHFDLLSLNLYGYGRTLLIDPGQYEYTPAKGLDRYWQSNIHSMLVKDGKDVERNPGPSEWCSNGIIDWFDGEHFGYAKSGSGDYVRRRVVFVKPDYFLVDDLASGSAGDWAQVWNLTDPQAKFDEKTGTIETNFASGGNLIILNSEPQTFSIEHANGITASKAYPQTKIFRLHRKTDKPRFASLLYPYNAGKRPSISWELMKSGNDDSIYGAKIKTNKGTDYAFYGKAGEVSAFDKLYKTDADFAFVRCGLSSEVEQLSLVNGRELLFNGKALVTSAVTIHSIAVRYDGAALIVDISEPDANLAIAVQKAKKIILNGKVMTKPVIRQGMYYPYADQALTIVSDDRTGFAPITRSNEWTRTPDPNSWSGGYTCHETDPGRRECGRFMVSVPKAGKYKLEVYLPKVTVGPSDRVVYRFSAKGVPIEPGKAVIAVQRDGNEHVILVNQQEMSGWVKLGDFTLPKGQFTLRATNVTQTDGLFLIADAVRVVKE